MVRSRFWFIAGLVVTGLGSLGLGAWAWLQGGVPWYHSMPRHGATMRLMPLAFLAVVVAGAVFWSHRRGARVDPLGDLALEYVEGRIDRQEFLAREAVLKESL